MWAIPDSSIFLESCFTLTYLWQSSAICYKVIFGSFSNLFSILHLISASFVETSPCTNTKHLKLSPFSSASLKLSVFPTDAKVVKSSFPVKLRHFHLAWKTEVFTLKSSISNSTASINVISQVFWGQKVIHEFWVFSCAKFTQKKMNFLQVTPISTICFL